MRYRWPVLGGTVPTASRGRPWSEALAARHSVSCLASDLSCVFRGNAPPTQNQCDADFDRKLITATPAIISAMPIIAGASRL